MTTSKKSFRRSVFGECTGGGVRGGGVTDSGVAGGGVAGGGVTGGGVAGRRAALALLCCGLLAACGSLPALAPAPAPSPTRTEAKPELVFLGQQILPFEYRFANTIVGGLSGIDYDPVSGRYWVISDDRSETGPARFYEVALDLARFSKAAAPGHAGVTFASVQTLRRLDGSAFANVRSDPARSVDPESIRVHAPSGRLVWSSEGERMVKAGEPPILIDPHIWEMQRDGSFVRSFVIPDKFRASPNNHGIRRNLAFEGLAFAPDFSTLFAMTENALFQDGPAASLTAGSPSRLIAFDYQSGLARAEYVIDIAPIPVAPTKAGDFADNGASEILGLDDHRLLLLERSYAVGVGNTIRLFVIDLRGATDVSGFDSLSGRAYVPAAKRLLFDFSSLGIHVDNLEGMTWGPALADGGRSLVFVSDDNFNRGQTMQFLAFEVRGL